MILIIIIVIVSIVVVSIRYRNFIDGRVRHMYEYGCVNKK